MPPIDDYDKMCSLDNLRRAYRWVQSNPDAQYKNYYRDSYSAYAASSDHNLRRLRKNLIRKAYDPGHAAKVYVPKPSGILRPITLLTVNDQIVYQACVNIIAENLNSKIKRRKNKQIFGHLYAGKSSKFFYLKWQDGYKQFTREVINNIKSGLDFVANFDLASFYDSIDHHVIKHFLNEIKIDTELTEFLLGCLKTWTCNTWTSVSNLIYHEHGIPQGPLSSGMLSEVILKHLDDAGIRKGSAKYLRYVDDIKLFSKNESTLRQRLISLDIAAKEVGLFPQSSKVNIRRVKNPLDEIKSVSRPPEPSVTPSVNNDALVKRLLEMVRGGSVNANELTRFKYLIAQCKPSHKLNARIIKLLYKQPFLSKQISTYFAKYQQIPRKASDDLLAFILGEEIYHSTHGDVLIAVSEKLPAAHRDKCAEFCHKRLFNPLKALPRLQPTYKAALILWVIKNNKITFAELEKLAYEEIDWWVMKSLVGQLEPHRYGMASYEALLNKAICIGNADVARNSALKIIEDDLKFTSSKDGHESARLLLFVGGKIRRIGTPESLVGSVLGYILTTKFKKYDWKKLLGVQDAQAEHIAFTVKKHFETDINACIVTLDSLLDLIFESLFLKFVPGKKYGQFGSMVTHPTIQALLPKTCSGFDNLHQLRLQSVTAHPRHTKSGGNTRRLKHYDFYKLKPKVKEAIQEIIDMVIP